MTDAKTTWSYPGLFVEEPMHARDSGAASGSERGVVLVTALNVPEARSDLLVFDAVDLELRARVPLPHHLPVGFHGRYVAGSPSA